MPSPQASCILHLGLGAFHRAHQAVYMRQLHQLGETSWHIAAGNIRPGMHNTIATLLEQNGNFTLETITPDAQYTYKRIQSITRIFPYQPHLTDLIACGADRQTRIISFTVTEAGYYLDNNNKLDWQNHRELAEGLAAARQGKPGSILYSVLTAILRERMHDNATPVTLLCCDNLRYNGYRSRVGFMQFIEALDDSTLRAWVLANTTFPNTMVDRITPRPTGAVIQRVLDATGVHDQVAIMAEDFTQWVIEDSFANERPPWEKVGVEIVTEVAPYEEAKIRLLNATHAAIAWAGTLIGYKYIHQGIINQSIVAFVYNYTQDVIDILDTSEHAYPINLPRYRDSVFARFANEALQDTNARVSMDAFSKIPAQIVPTIYERLSRGKSIAQVAILPALFLAFLQRWHSGYLPFTYVDQAMDSQLAHAICEAKDPITAFASEPVLWGDIASDMRLIDALHLAKTRVDTFEKQHTLLQSSA